MEVLTSNTAFDNEERALKSLFDRFGVVLSLEVIRSTFCKAGRDADVAGALLSELQTNPSDGTPHVPNNLVKIGTSKISDNNGFINPSYTNEDCVEKSSRSVNNSVEKALGSRRNFASRGTFGKEYVWRAKVRQDEVSCDDNAFNSSSCYTDGNNDTKVSKLEKVNSSVDVNLADSFVNIEINSRKSCDNDVFDNGSICCENGNDDIELNLEKVHDSIVVPSLRLKNSYASLNRVSSVWRPKVQDANLTSEKSSYNGDVKSQSSNSSDNNDSSKSSYAGRSDDSRGLRLKGKPVFTGVVGKDYVWRVRTNETPNEEISSKEEVNNTLRAMHSYEESLSRRNVDSSVKKDFEDFLLDTLGRSLQLEKSAIQEVLGNCEYDMKKSLETVLDLAARTLDNRNGFRKGINSNFNLSKNGEQSQKLAKSGTMRYSRILSGQPNERHEQPKEVIETILSEPRENTAEDNNAQEDSYQILRKTVQEYRDTAKEYYQAAVEAYASGNRAQSSVLLEKGQFFSNKAREADEQSAEEIFAIRDGEMRDDMCLDLQHHDAKEAVRLVKCHLRSLPGNSFNNLKIVVGIGLEDVEKRKRMVTKLLEREAIEWTEDKNAGTIAVRLDKINPKCLSFARR